MVYFFVSLSHNELQQFKKGINRLSFCLVRRDNLFYGCVPEAVYPELLEILSAETLQHLEYLDEKEFSEIINSVDATDFLGNTELLSGMKFRK
jgi:hypothetical protein